MGENKKDVFTLMAEATREVSKRTAKKKVTSFVKKVTVDLDQEHLNIIENYQKKEGVHSGLRGTIWEGLELLAQKYGL